MLTSMVSMTNEPRFGEPGKANDGRWHATETFSPRPIPVHTLRGIQHHRGAHAVVQRWTGTKWVYERCGDIHKNRKTTSECSKWLANKLNKRDGF